MYVGPFVGEGTRLAAFAANVLYGTLNELPKVDLKRVRNAEKRLEVRRPLVAFEIADAGLGEAGRRRKLRHGNSLTLALLGKQFGNSFADFVVVILSGHAVLVAERSVDNGHHSCDGSA